MPVVLEDMCVAGFAGNGINLDSNQTPTAYPNGEPNNNYTRIWGGRIVENDGHGILLRGKNSNAGTIGGGVDVTSSGAWGYYDVSDLGNGYVGCHAASNKQGHYFSRNGSANRSKYLTCYCET